MGHRSSSLGPASVSGLQVVQALALGLMIREDVGEDQGSSAKQKYEHGNLLSEFPSLNCIYAALHKRQ